MTTWIIVSWVFVGILTGINIFIFLKLKGAADQMMKMAFPNAKNMNEAMGQMQGMLSMAGKMGGPRGVAQNPQLKAAMDMLNQVNKGKHQGK